LGTSDLVTTGTFLTTMGVEEMDDLRRCDFVRAVEYLTPSAIPAQTQSACKGIRDETTTPTFRTPEELFSEANKTPIYPPPP
jgi:hypothetical protein